MVEIIEKVVDVPLSFDSTNLLGIEAGLKKVTKAQPIINSTSAEPERLEKVPLLAKQYGSRVIALTMGSSGIPVAADERVNIAVESLIPRMLEIDFPMKDLIIDPLVLTVSGFAKNIAHSSSKQSGHYNTPGIHPQRFRLVYQMFRILFHLTTGLSSTVYTELC